MKRAPVHTYKLIKQIRYFFKQIIVEYCIAGEVNRMIELKTSDNGTVGSMRMKG